MYNVGYEGKDFEAKDFLNGYSHPWVAVILDENPAVATAANWGLLPVWAKDRSLQKLTLNAKIETIAEKPSFRNNVQKRCLVLVKGFYEWKWLDGKGKVKQKHFLALPKSIKIFGSQVLTNYSNKEKMI